MSATPPPNGPAVFFPSITPILDNLRFRLPAPPPNPAKIEAAKIIQRAWRRHNLVNSARKSVAFHAELLPRKETRSLPAEELIDRLSDPEVEKAAENLYRAIDVLASSRLPSRARDSVIVQPHRAFLRAFFIAYQPDEAFAEQDRLTQGLSQAAKRLLRTFDRTCLVLEGCQGTLSEERELRLTESLTEYREARNLYFKRLQKWSERDARRLIQELGQMVLQMEERRIRSANEASLEMQDFYEGFTHSQTLLMNKIRKLGNPELTAQIEQQLATLRSRMEGVQAQRIASKRETLIHELLVNPDFDLPDEPDESLYEALFHDLRLGMRKEPPDLRQALHIVQEIRGILLRVSGPRNGELDAFAMALNNEKLEKIFTHEGLDKKEQFRGIVGLLFNHLSQLEKSDERAKNQTWEQRYGQMILKEERMEETLPALLHFLMRRCNKLLLSQAHDLVARVAEENAVDFSNGIQELRESFARQVEGFDLGTNRMHAWLKESYNQAGDWGITQEQLHAASAPDHLVTHGIIDLLGRDVNALTTHLPETFLLAQNRLVGLKGYLRQITTAHLIKEELPKLLGSRYLHLDSTNRRDLRVDLQEATMTSSSQAEAIVRSIDLAADALHLKEHPIDVTARKQLQVNLAHRIAEGGVTYAAVNRSLLAELRSLLYHPGKETSDEFEMLDSPLRNLADQLRPLLRVNLLVHRDRYLQAIQKLNSRATLDLLKQTPPFPVEELPKELAEKEKRFKELHRAILKMAFTCHGLTILREALFNGIPEIEEGEKGKSRVIPQLSYLYLTTGTPAASDRISDSYLIDVIAGNSKEVQALLQRLEEEGEESLDEIERETVAKLKAQIEELRASQRYTLEQVEHMVSGGFMSALLSCPDTEISWPIDSDLSAIPELAALAERVEQPAFAETFFRHQSGATSERFVVEVAALDKAAKQKLLQPKLLLPLFNEQGLSLHRHAKRHLTDQDLAVLLRFRGTNQMLFDSSKKHMDIRNQLMTIARGVTPTDEEISELAASFDLPEERIRRIFSQFRFNEEQVQQIERMVGLGLKRVTRSFALFRDQIINLLKADEESSGIERTILREFATEISVMREELNELLEADESELPWDEGDLPLLTVPGRFSK